MKTLDPIFVHASPRSGSTYFFNVLRRNPDLMCFNEAISDVYHIKQNPKWNTHHDFLEQDDLAELKAAWKAGVIPPPYPAFNDYCGLTRELEIYINRLVTHAKSYGKRPIFCEIYSRYRVKALREKFGGFHIAQIRDFEPQFGSFIRALVEGGEWGFLALPWLEDGLSAIDAINAASKLSLTEVEARHVREWCNSNRAAIEASDAVLSIDDANDRDLMVKRLALRNIDINFNDYKYYPPYPIPTEQQWRVLVRKHRPNFKIAVSKLPFARRLYGKLNQLRQTA